MAIAAVSDWLRTDGDFNLGVELLKRYGIASAPTMYLLSCGDSTLGRRKLRECLERINAASNERRAAVEQQVKPQAPGSRVVREGAVSTDATAVAEVVLGRVLSDAMPRLDDTQMPPQLRKLKDELAALHRHESYLRGQLAITPDGPGLTEIRDNLIAVFDRKKAGWRRIEAWRVTGKDIAETAQKPVSVHALILERNSLRAQLSKVKHGKAKPDEARDAQRRVRLEEITKLLEQHAA